MQISIVLSLILVIGDMHTANYKHNFIFYNSEHPRDRRVAKRALVEQQLPGCFQRFAMLTSSLTHSALQTLLNGRLSSLDTFLALELNPMPCNLTFRARSAGSLVDVGSNTW